MFCQTAFGSFAVAAFYILAGFVHGFDYRIKGNFSGVGKEVRKGNCVYGTHCRNGISLDAGDLNKTVDRIAGESEHMLH